MRIAREARRGPFMHYDIEADWHLLDTCNYRCDYCFFPPEMLGRKLATAAAPAAWCDAFAATGLTWLLHLTGGEPTIYPDFAGFSAALTRRHFISLNTNLSHPSILAFCDKVDPARVDFINAGFHYDERVRRAGLPVFLRHLRRLREAGFPVFVSVVATPPVLAEMDAIVEALGPAGLRPVPKLFRGRHAGRHYPRAYSDVERSLFRHHSRLAQRAYAELLEGRAEPPTIDPFADEAFVEGVPDYRGRQCAAGSRFVRIDPRGAVKRCGATALGNLLDGTFARWLQPKPCDTSYCFYFCEKYAATAARAERPSVAPGV